MKSRRPSSSKASTKEDDRYLTSPDPAAAGSSTRTSTQGDAATPHSIAVPGDQFGRYRILKEIGRGGMGAVYLAEDTRLGRNVALKMPHFGKFASPETIERFYREARLAACLQHPNICPVHDVDEVDGHHYLTMAYIEGRPLSQHVAALSAGPPRVVADLLNKVALGLEEAHRHGIIHRDLKPSNIMIDARGEPIIMDFGLARQADTGSDHATRPGHVVGTPAYMPPEQALGDITALGPRSDVYSLGVVLFELLTGRLPFEGPTTAVLVKVVHEAPPRPSQWRPALDPRLEAICLKTLQKDPTERHASMEELSLALLAFLREEATNPVVSANETNVDVPTRVARELLSQLRLWGWERGLDACRGPTTTPDPEGDAFKSDLMDWVGGGEQLAATTQKALDQNGYFPVLQAWRELGSALRVIRMYEFRLAEGLIEKLTGATTSLHDPVLGGSARLLAGYLHLRAGRLDEAISTLHEAIALVGRDHFIVGRVLETLGDVYAVQCNFQAAQEFYRQAILIKERHHDDAGAAYSHGQLGRLYVDWADLDRAEEHLKADLALLQKIEDEHGQPGLFHQLGRIALARGELEANTGHKGEARHHFEQAAELFDWCITRHQQPPRQLVPEARVRTSRAWLCLAQGEAEVAEAHAQQALDLFIQGNFNEGKAWAQLALAAAWRMQGRAKQAVPLLRAALAIFDQHRQVADAAEAQLEYARALQVTKAMPQMVRQAFADALDRAESSRRSDLVEVAEEELRVFDKEAYWRHVYRRVRGRAAPERTSRLTAGSNEVLTALFLNLRDFVNFSQALDPEEVLLTLNQLLADLETSLERHKAEVNAFLGGGFMVLFRESGHAQRAVRAALDLQAVVQAFNRPRTLLGLRELPAEIGIASGSAFVGNVGTYRRMNFTAVGPAVNLAARLMRQGLKDLPAPCISRETYDMIRDRFLFAPSNPRLVDLKGLGQREVWDVVGIKPDVGSSSR